MTDLERDVWAFAMYYDFMSYVAQNLRGMYEKGKSLTEGRYELKEVIMECSSRFTHSQEELVMTMCAIVNESYPEPSYIKDGNSDYQTLDDVTTSPQVWVIWIKII